MAIAKKIASLATVLALAFSSAAAAPPKRHPLYPAGEPKAVYAAHVPESIDAVMGDCSGAALEQIRQSIYINVPGFYLRQENKIGDQLCSSYTFPVRVGRHWEKHFGKINREMETPIGEGSIVDKKWSGIFRYFDDVWKKKCVRYEKNKKNKLVCVEQKRILVHRKGEVIRETSTYTDDALPMTVPIEYEWMHALGMKIYPEGKSSYTTRCVIHATTDSHTVGNATSHCCVGLRIDEMLKLYGLVVPEQERGEVKTDVALKLDYKVVERRGDELVLHADVYDRKEDYVTLIGQELRGMKLDGNQVQSEVNKARAQFGPAYVNLRKKLLADKFITREEVGKLHYSIPIADLVEKR